MKKRIEVSAEDLQQGDVVLEFSTYWITVEREVSGPKPGTAGTAIVHGIRTHGMIDEDGDFRYLAYDSYDGEVLSEYVTAEDFVAYEDEPKPVVAPKPQITREQFIDTIASVVEDNNIAVDNDALGRIAAFSADRLGLR